VGRSANLIPDHCERITPEMLTLVELDPAQIAEIVATFPASCEYQGHLSPGTVAGGILFSSPDEQETGGDTYVLPTLLAVDRKRSRT